MNLRVALAGWAVATVVGCSSGDDEKTRPEVCPDGDVDCFLDALEVSASGKAVALRTIDAALLAPTVQSGGPVTIWSVAASGLEGWDGAHWALADTGGDPLSAVWTGSTSNAWAVGPTQRIDHWDGTAWTTASVGSDVTRAYYAVWGSAEDDVYAGGSGGTLVHYNGTTWSPVDAGTTDDIRVIGGSSGSDVWLGGFGNALHHWNGATWTSFPANASLSLTSIWVQGPSEAWAVGDGNQALHWTGAAWAPVTLPGTSYAYAVWGSSASDVWAVGYEITQGTFLLHWDGGAWTASPRPSGMSELGALWGRSATDIWLGGSGNMGHWNGTAWTVLTASGGVHTKLHGLVLGATATALPPTITNQPPPMVFNGPDTTVNVTLDWTDDSGCTPAFCMQVCSSSVRCSAKARCSPLVNDGLRSGSTIRTVGYSAAPASPPETLSLNVVPVSSADCGDPIARLVAGSPDVLMSGATTITQTFNAAPPTTPIDNGSHDGTWNLTVTISSCYAFTHTVPITIANGAFSGHLFQYCAEPVNGTTTLSTGSCGANLAEDVALSLTVDRNTIEGVLTLTGGGCNGANGIEGRFTSANAGQAASFWGGLEFSK